jgi:hypothetical protein
MKTASTYVLMFVANPLGWLFPEPMVPGFGGGSNGGSPINEKNSGAPGWPERQREQCEASALPNHLFWTWFVDNPRPVSKSS